MWLKFAIVTVECAGIDILILLYPPYEVRTGDTMV